MGGNFAAAKLVPRHHALSNKRRLSSYLRVMAASFVFLSSSALSSCTSDDNEQRAGAAAAVAEPARQPDYHSEFTAHEWEIAKAQQWLGDFGIDVREADVYCRFSVDSVYFSTGAMNYYFDEHNNVTGKYEITASGKYPYSVEAEKIEIDGQTFTITSQADCLVLTNEDWRLVLKDK